jgi:prophage antirepressor-like protein
LARAPENLTKPDKVALKPEPKTGTKRYLVEIDGEPWFVGSAWRALGYSNTSDAITRPPSDHRRLVACLRRGR